MKIPNLAEESLPESVLPLLNVIKEHALAVLRLSYQEETHYYPAAAWAFFDEGQDYNFGLRIEIRDNEVVNADLAKALFVHSYPYKHELRLLVDGNDPHIPVPYRFLALYKLLEHEFKTKGEWRTSDLEAFVGTYDSEFKKLGISKSPTNHLHDLRDRCAHIRTGRSKEAIGVNSLNHKETIAVQQMLPVMRDIGRDLINRKSTSTFQLASVRNWYEKLQTHGPYQPVELEIEDHNSVEQSR